MKEKIEELVAKIQRIGKDGVCLAFSGGTDSSLVLKLLKISGVPFLAVSFKTCLHPQIDLEIAKDVADEIGAELLVLELNELSDSEIYKNPQDRCYRCKYLLFSELKKIAKEKKLAVVFDGTNYDDLGQFRPGLQALEELEICSILAEQKTTKPEVREMAKLLNISVSQRPSEPCLATRLPYNTILNFTILKKLEEGEKFFKKNGISVVRLRLHDKILRIEILPEFFPKFIEQKVFFIDELKRIGFHYITLDLEGFRSGSMDEIITK